MTITSFNDNIREKVTGNMNYVLITGGTSGIGYELARQFAENNYNLIIASENMQKLQSAKAKLEQEFNINVIALQQNLSQLDGAMNLYRTVKEMKIKVSVLVNNAGVGVTGSFETVDVKQEENMLVLNMVNLTQLTKLFIKDMYRQKEGMILNVASTGAFQPGPYTSTYYATKAYVLSLSRALRYEAKKKGVQVCTLCPGATSTEFFARAGKALPAVAMSAEKVASIAYTGLMNNKEIIVPGLGNKTLRLIPTKIRMIGIAKYQMGLIIKKSIVAMKK